MYKQINSSFIISIFGFLCISASIWSFSSSYGQPVLTEQIYSFIMVFLPSVLFVVFQKIKVSALMIFSVLFLIVFFSSIMAFSFHFSITAYLLIFCGLTMYFIAVLITPADVTAFVLTIVFFFLMARFMRLDFFGELLESLKGSLESLVLFVITLISVLMLKQYDIRRLSLSEKSEALETSVRQLTAAATSFLEYANSVEEKSSLEERKRITRDLHDVVGQSNTNIIAMMNAVLRKPLETDEERRKMYQWILKISQKCLNESRTILKDIHNLPENKLNGIPRFNELLETFRISTCMKIHVEWANLPYNLPFQIENILYSILQESLTNSFRHGQASEITVIFQKDNGNIFCNISDNGSMKEQNPKGLGQKGLKERLESIGGTISFRSEKTGYNVRAVIPEKNE